MTGEDAASLVMDALEALGVQYMLVGSFSSNFYGVPRATADADFVVQLGQVSVSDIAAPLRPRLALDPQSRFETVTGTTRYIFRAAETPFEVELFLLSDDLFDQERFSRRFRTKLLGRDTFLPTAEDVIIMKLLWSRRGERAKDLEDARNVIFVQREALDWDYIHRWCDQHGTRELLDKIRRSLPPVD
jgi:hypothetical protein